MTKKVVKEKSYTYKDFADELVMILDENDSVSVKEVLNFESLCVGCWKGDKTNYEDALVYRDWLTDHNCLNRVRHLNSQLQNQLNTLNLMLGGEQKDVVRQILQQRAKLLKDALVGAEFSKGVDAEALGVAATMTDSTEEYRRMMEQLERLRRRQPAPLQPSWRMNDPINFPVSPPQWQQTNIPGLLTDTTDLPGLTYNDSLTHGPFYGLITTNKGSSR